VTRVWLWAPVVLYAAAIFALSSTAKVPAPPTGLSDKHVHFIVYGGLCALLVRALAAGRWARVTARVATWAFVLTTIYGASDEIHQHFVPGRSTDVQDLIADGAGALAAAGLLLAWAIIRRCRQDDSAV